ncbi:hypothetical protein, partial [Pseudomonas syringae group genomosp. 3]|uniref:hypothetical protein n=1 Tax=Pseudomonas syringae group genomosp. 3 TaxID=251701 RepID=UPI001C3F26D8
MHPVTLRVTCAPPYDRYLRNYWHKTNPRQSNCKIFITQKHFKQNYFSHIASQSAQISKIFRVGVGNLFTINLDPINKRIAHDQQRPLPGLRRYHACR